MFDEIYSKEAEERWVDYFVSLRAITINSWEDLDAFKNAGLKYFTELDTSRA